MPLFYLELILGQYYRQGSISCWKKICPLLAGIGWAVTIIAFYTDFYYNVVISWGLYYLFASFQRILPWSKCSKSYSTTHENDFLVRLSLIEKPWSTNDCSTIETRRLFIEECTHRLNQSLSNSLEKSFERSYLYENCSQELTRMRTVSPAQEYFQ